MAELFGFELKRKKQEKEQRNLESFVPPSNDDGSLSVTEGGVYGTYVDLDGSIRTEAELVTKYRSISLDPIVDMAIMDIVNESIVDDSDDDTISLLLDNLEISESIKKKVQDEFSTILRLLEFDHLSYELFKRWYVDGRMYYHAIIDESKPKEGLKELRYIDPRHIKKIREVRKEKTQLGVEIEKLVAEYYIYSKDGFQSKSGSYGGAPASASTTGTKIAKDSIVYCTSGYQNVDNNLILSYLHKAIRPLNNLRSMENSLVIYRISRAPERKIFYVDVGGLPKPKAEQYLREIMNKFKNRTVYDSETGEIRDDRKFMTMLEDYWLPRRDGNRGTEITTLPGGQNLGEIEDVEYFQNLLYRSLNVPASRLQPDTAFALGRATEISRDEVRFSKFITRIRKKFSELFTKLLERQLILKGICTVDDWREWKHKIQYQFAVDNFFAELKNMEMNRDRVGLLREVDEYIGRYYSHEHVRRNILQQTDEDIKEIDKQIKAEENDPKYKEDENSEFGLKTEPLGGGGAEEPAPQEEPPPEKEPKSDSSQQDKPAPKEKTQKQAEKDEDK